MADGLTKFLNCLLDISSIIFLPPPQEFTTEVVSMLWAYSQHEHPVIASAAFTALAAFAGQGFQLDLLPKSVSTSYV